MIDIETLLVHHPTLTVGEYFKLFPLPDTPVEKPKSELSKQLEVQVLTYQSAINDMIGCEDRRLVVKPFIPVRIKKQDTKFRSVNY